MVPVEIRKRIKPGQCANVNCDKSVGPRGANARNKYKYCNTCRCRISRINDPVKYSYYNKKNRAKQRKSKKWPNGIPFTISLDFFRKWCYRVRYIKGAGRTVDCYDCDRIKEDEGYHEWNIQRLRKDKNIKKYHKQKRLNYYWQDGKGHVTELQEADYSKDPDAF